MFAHRAPASSVALLAMPLARRASLRAACVALGVGSVVLGQAHAQSVAPAPAGDAGAPTAQSQAEPAATRPAGPSARIEFYGGQSFEADFSNTPGTVSVGRAGVDFSSSFPVAERTRLGISANAEWIWYSFDNAASLGPPVVPPAPTDKPWDTVRSYALSGNWFQRYDDRWSTLLALQVSASGEDGAKFGDALEFGGTFQAIYAVREGLALGLGVVASTRIEDNALVIPIPVVDWRFAQRWRLATDVDHYSVGGSLSYEVSDDWSVGAKVGFHSRDFRLAEDNLLAPEGVGRHSAIPINLWAQWQFHPQGSLRLAAGYLLGQEYVLDNRDGDRIAKQDVDGAPFVNLSLTWSF